MSLSKTGIFRKLADMTEKRWVILPDSGPSRRELSHALSISDATARILANRLPDPTVEAARAFLQPSLAHMCEPWRLVDMEKAVDRLQQAVHDRESIIVYGDYDSDGVTACALLLRVFRAIGLNVEPYLPDRVDEGYGLSEAFIHRVNQLDVGVVVTVDCGVSDYTEVAALQQSGIDVIVTDHHEPGGEDLPPALAVINPKRQGSTYPFRELTGVGVAFKLAWALCERISGSKRVRPDLRQALLDVLPYVALGTITDVAPLLDENRVYARFGLERLEESQYPGLKALLEVADLTGKSITPREVSFVLGPRINAAGRMQDARLALDLLTTDDDREAAEKALQLNQENINRQRLCASIYDEARRQVEETIELDSAIATVVVGEGWHEGVIGIVASKLVDEFRRPSVVIALSEDGLRGKGSARSIPGLHLYRAMSRSRQRFESFGGHEMAAGFSLVRDQIEPFRQEFNAECRRQVVEGGLEPELIVDLEVRLPQLGNGFANEVQLLAPFGQGNQAPLFLSRHVKVAGRPQLMGRTGRHFSFYASQDQTAFRAIVFNRPDWLKRIESHTDYWDIVYSLRFNDYYAPPRLELRIEDMRPS
jgi:single-stranded-DNA-specific exonuclease